MRLMAITWMIALCGLTIARAESPGHSAAIDVVVSSTGELVSQCQDVNGRGIANAVVGLYQSGSRIAGASSAPDGWFTIHGVRPGVYELKSGEWHNAVRVWRPESAPPGASDPIAIILETRPPKNTAESVHPLRAKSPTQTPAIQSPAASGTPDLVTASAVAGAAGIGHATLSPSPEPDIEQVTTHREPIRPAVSNEPFNPFAHAPLPSEMPAPAPPLPETSSQQAMFPPAPVRPKSQPPTELVDADFNPFSVSTTQPLASLSEPELEQPFGQPAEDELAPGPSQEMQVEDGQLNGAGPVADLPLQPTGSPPPMPYQPVTYQPGPTVGDVVTATAIGGAIAVGAVAIYRYDNRKDRVRVVVSP